MSRRAFVVLFLHLGLLDPVDLGLVDDLDLEVAELDVDLVQLLRGHHAVREGIVDVAVGQVALLLGQSDELFDLLRQLGIGSGFAGKSDIRRWPGGGGRVGRRCFRVAMAVAPMRPSACGGAGVRARTLLATDGRCGLLFFFLFLGLAAALLSIGLVRLNRNWLSAFGFHHTLLCSRLKGAKNSRAVCWRPTTASRGMTRAYPSIETLPTHHSPPYGRDEFVGRPRV
jgi:hypothetical protein